MALTSSSNIKQEFWTFWMLLWKLHCLVSGLFLPDRLLNVLLIYIPFYTVMKMHCVYGLDVFTHEGHSYVGWYMISFCRSCKGFKCITFWTAERLEKCWYLKQIPVSISQWVLALSIWQVWNQSGHFNGGYNMEHGSHTLCWCLQLFLCLHTTCRYSRLWFGIPHLGFSPFHKYVVSWASCCCCLNENRWLSTWK